MRKVYQNDSMLKGLPISIGISVAFTALLFGIIPFAHRINKPERTLELRSTRAVDLPPPDEEKPPPQFEVEPPPPAPPAPQLADTPQQQLAISADLEVALGGGGAMAGIGGPREIVAAAAVEEDAFDVADLQKRPEAISQVPPVYPEALQKAKVEGVVTLVFVLSEEGRVEDPRVESSSRPEFEKPALDAIRKWRFRPGEKDGKAVRTYLRQPLRFRISSG